VIGERKTESEEKGRGDRRGAAAAGWQAGGGEDGYPGELAAVTEKSRPRGLDERC
jgi:hypothetical protein